MILCSIRTALRHLACLTGNDVSFKSVPDEKSLRRADPLVMQPARTPPPPEFATQQSLDDDGKPELLLVNCQAYFFFFGAAEGPDSADDDDDEGADDAEDDNEDDDDDIPMPEGPPPPPADSDEDSDDSDDIPMPEGPPPPHARLNGGKLGTGVASLMPGILTHAYSRCESSQHCKTADKLSTAEASAALSSTFSPRSSHATTFSTTTALQTSSAKRPSVTNATRWPVSDPRPAVGRTSADLPGDATRSTVWCSRSTSARLCTTTTATANRHCWTVHFGRWGFRGRGECNHLGCSRFA